MVNLMAEPPLGSYLVLGASGLAGYHALKKLAHKPGITVTAMHHLRAVQITADNIRTVQFDLRQMGGLDEIMKGHDYVLHFAGIVATVPVLMRDPIGPVNDTLAIVANVLAAAWRSEVRKVIWLSSTTGYPELDHELVEADMFVGNPPPTWYAIGWMSRYLETLCQAYVEYIGKYSENQRMIITALRPTLMFGENDDFSFDHGHFLPAMIRRVVERHNPIEIWGDGEQTRDLIYAGDVVDAAFLSLDRSKGFESFNISSGNSITINQVVKSIIEIDSFNNARIEHKLDRLGSRKKIRISNKKARNLLDFVPSTPLNEGLKATINWYRSVNKIS